MRPPFKNGGGKKGMRQVTGKHQKKIILRPAPIPESKKGKERSTSEDPQDPSEEEHEEEEEEEDTEQYGYRESLQQDRRPLAGFRISVSGCRELKQDLLEIAQEYGAERQGALHIDTTHLITDRPEGAKYKIALERKMAIMLPSWLPAVREAWTSGEKIDWDQLELAHRLKPLQDVVFCLTQFAQGDYKDSFKELLLDAGAAYTSKLNASVTHLIVASPSSPHSQTPASDKLLHASKSRRHLHPHFEVMWEGWAREAVKFGGRREERDRVWRYREGGGEPEQDLSWTVEEPPKRGIASTTPGPSTQQTQTSTSNPVKNLSQTTSRELTGRLVGGGGDSTTRKFTGYDQSIIDTVEEEQSRRTAAAETNHDLLHGKILKKRRRTNNNLAPDASQGNPEQLFDIFGQISVDQNNNVALNPNPNPNLNSAQALFNLPPQADDQQLELPIPPIGFKDEDMVYEMREGQVGLQRTKKSKSAIKAITLKRSISEVEKKTPKSFSQAQSQKIVGMEEDDSGFLDNTTAFGEGGGLPIPSNSSSSTDSIPGNIFTGLTLAVMGIKARDPQIIAGIITRGGGTCLIDATEEELETVDWIVVDFVEPPERFMNSKDERVVSVCWIEVCIWEERVVPLLDRILDRPIPYPCPVKGAENLLVHFSGWQEDDGPYMHHNRRFLHAVGVEISTSFNRSCTHLILYDLEENPSLSLSEIDENGNRKLVKAREWGKRVVSMRDFRKEMQRLAMGEEEGEEETRSVKGKGKGKERECGKEITNQRRGEEEEEESMKLGGPLEECVVCFSTKSNFDRQHLANIVKDLGGTAARQYSESITHFVYSDPIIASNHSSKGGTRATAAGVDHKDLKLAKTNKNCRIVHPRWVEECGRTGIKVQELDFPSTFDSGKGGQLFEVGMSMAPSPPPPARNSPPRAERSITSMEMKRTPSTSKGKGKQLEFDQEEEEKEDERMRSPSPRRRRRSNSSSTRTEVAVEEEEEEEEAKLPPPQQAENLENRSASSSSRARNPFTSTTTNASSSSRPIPHYDDEEEDHSTLEPLSAIPPRQTDERELERRREEEKKRKDDLLRAQTDMLKKAMAPIGNGEGRSKLNPFKKHQSIPHLSTSPSKRKNSSPTRTTSLPTLLPSSSPSHPHPHPHPDEPQSLNLPHPPSSSAVEYTQSQAFTGEEINGGGGGGRVMFNEPEAIEAKERILKRQREAAEEEKRRQREEEGSQGRRVTRSARKGMY
ncbi:uncharacterized protein JCM6883_000258 [Sporobolomyces salmoneus]|uniref:uncharacterized protein n=1 Tax=Sporobolomyces salmoneus TaxID=183962 RepID=UPI003179FA5B